MFKFAYMTFKNMRYKNLVFATMLSIGAVVCLASCNGVSEQEASSDNDIEFEQIGIERTFALEPSDDSPMCNLDISVKFPAQSETYDLGSIQKIFQNSIIGSDYNGMDMEDGLEKYAHNYIENYKRDAEVFKTTRPNEDYGEEFDDLYHEDGEHANLPDVFYSYYETITDSIAYNHYGVLSYQVKQTNSKGGDVSYESVRNYSINLGNGQLLDEDDIFVAGYDVSLRPIIQSYLMQANGVKSIDDLEDIGYFGIDEIVPNGNFLITETAIIYTYNKGEYSAYQLPASNVVIPYSSVRSILRDGSVVSKLSKR